MRSVCSAGDLYQMIDNYIIMQWIAQHPSLAILLIAFWMGAVCTALVFWLSNK